MGRRGGGQDVYGQGTRQKIPFNDGRIVQSCEEMDKVRRADGTYYGGRKGSRATAFGDAMNAADAEQDEGA